jgi:enoyl-CoA hydratase/carnithine racemase
VSYETIATEVRDRILTITLNRPDRLNAFTSSMLEELLQALDDADADDEVRAIIFTGAGRGYCAGADLERGGATFDRNPDEEEAEERDGGGRLTLRLFECRKPVIAAINGPAVGVGITMTLAMDIRIASDKARIGFVFARRGIVPEACATWFLPRVVGISQAMEWVATGRVFSAQEALEGRLVSRVVAAEDLLPTARAIAAEIVDNTSAVSVCLSRHLLWKMLTADHPMEAHKLDSKALRSLGRLPDAYEGVSSFLEKRQPSFTMSAATDLPEFFPWWEERRFSDDR